MIEEGKIILKFNINFKRQMIIVEDDKVSAMSYTEFFQCYFSSKRIGVIESDFTYSTFDELIEKSISLKVGTSQMATYIFLMMELISSDLFFKKTKMILLIAKFIKFNLSTLIKINFRVII